MMLRTFQEDLDKALNFHGHICVGQVLGVRIARLGMKQFGITMPETYRDLIVFVEADRCIADAVASVCHCNLGRRRLKWMDYGKMAATFYDIQTDKAYRIHNSNRISPEKGEDIVRFFEKYEDHELFTIEEVQVDITEFDIPGKPKVSVWCEACNEKVLDNRHIEKDGRFYCKRCAGATSYYTSK